MKSLFTAALLLAFLAPAASADLEIVTSTTDMGDKPETTTGSMTMGKDRISVKGADAKKGPSRIIFRGDLDVLWIIDDPKKEYTAIDRETMAQIGTQMSAAAAKIQEQMATLTPEQRAMVEKAMKGTPMGAEQPPKPAREITKSDETKKVGDYDCTRYDVLVDGKKVKEAWVTPWASLKVTSADFAAFKELGAFMEEFMAAMKPMAGGLGKMNVGEDFESFDGIPVLTRSFDGGTVTAETKIESVTRVTPAPGTYDVDKGYGKKEMGKQAVKDN